MVISNSNHQCMVQMKRKRGMEVKTLSTIQFAKGVHRDEASYITTLKAEEVLKLVGELLKEVGQLLQYFRNVMSIKLPKKLSPKKEVDHKIDLKPNIKPLTSAPYCMSPSKLEELRK